LPAPEGKFHGAGARHQPWEREPVPGLIAAIGVLNQPIEDPPSEPENPESPPPSCPPLVAESLDDADGETDESSPPSAAMGLAPASLPSSELADADGLSVGLNEPVGSSDGLFESVAVTVSCLAQPVAALAALTPIVAIARPPMVTFATVLIFEATPRPPILLIIPPPGIYV
jgi:hypothetical protein